MYDILLLNGLVVDGSGGPAFSADVGIKDGAIVRIGRLEREQAVRTQDVTGLCVCPGFIDLHTHSDATLLVNPLAESAVRQGVTTEVVGNCGHSLAPAPRPDELRALIFGVPGIPIEWCSFGDYLRRLGRDGLAINVGALVGHGTLRLAAAGFSPRKVTPGELDLMKHELAAALEQGALGLSLGLEYAPGNSSDESELVELARVVAEHDGLLTSHMRNRDYRYLESLEEMLIVQRRANVRLQLSHLTSKYGAWPGVAERAIAKLEQAAAEGDVAADMLPYVWGMSSIPASVLPPWAFEGGLPAVLARLRDGPTRQRVREYDNPLWKVVRDGLWDRLVLLSSRSRPEWAGQTIAAIADRWGKDGYDTLFDLMLADGDEMYGLCWAGRNVEDAELEAVLVHPRFSVASDGMTLAPYGDLDRVAWHPTSFGWAARILGHYVREKKILTFEQAVAKMTSGPARRLCLPDRGRLLEGYKADLAVIDAAAVRDNATLANPKSYASGVPYVIVNGVMVVDRGEHTGARPGELLRRRARRPNGQAIRRQSKTCEGDE